MTTATKTKRGRGTVQTTKTATWKVLINKSVSNFLSLFDLILQDETEAGDNDKEKEGGVDQLDRDTNNEESFNEETE